MQLTPQTIYYYIAAISVGGGVLWAAGKYLLVKPIQYFTELKLILLGLSGDIHEIKTNHLPHIYERITRIEEQFEIREDSASHAGRDRNHQGQGGPDAD